ncbi:MAG: ABC transporter ATP-binding protein [Fibrobacter sp.]|nr:ABC transporter ATP-binding protein [Fibrobacter sp.]
MNIVAIEALTKDYSLDSTTVHALRGVDLNIKSGELLSVMGPSGSGKTTLLNIIGCVDTPTSGKVEVAGTDIGSLKDKELTDLRLRKIGFIFQTFNLIPVLNTLENVEFPLLLMKEQSATDIRRKAKDLLHAVGLGDHLHHRPAELSGGQRQRVAIARALVTEPALVLADEPTANLDSATGASILDLMVQMNQSLGTTFLFSTHDPDVQKYAQRIVKIHDGLIQDD